MGFLAFWACCCGLLDHQGVLLIWASWPLGRAAVGCLAISGRCCFGLLGLLGVAAMAFNYPACPPVWLNLPSTPFCTVEFNLHALKGQKLLAQGNALGINDIQLTPCKGKSFTYRRGFSIFIRCILKLLPLQGALLNAIIPRALPWAMSFCPFRACCLYGLLGLQGVAALGFLAFWACCLYGLLDLLGVLLLWTS